MTTVSYSLAPEPIWTLIGTNGLTAGGGYINTLSSINKSVKKDTFVDPGGQQRWPNPIVFDMNGTHKPIYFEFDSANPSDTYFLEAFDAQNNPLWTVDNFFPGGSGGGGNTNTYLPLVNYIANNQFIDHIPSQAGPLPTNLVLCASNHKGFTPALINPVVGTYGVLGPDIRFIKNNTNATDSITFTPFILGNNPLTDDACPVEYINYVCSNAPLGEQYKDFQFPICQKIQTLAGQPMTFNLWAMYTTSPATLNVYTRQYYGSGTAATVESTSTRQLVGSIVLTNSWAPYNIQFNMPAIVPAGSLGTPGKQTNDDATYIELEMPLGASCNISFTKPALYLGSIDPGPEFQSYDQIESINSTPRTGDIRVSLTSSAPLGWLLMNDTSIGNTGSGATTAGAFTFQLYATLYTSVNNTYAPVSGGRTAPGTTMANAITDFLLGKTLTMPLSLGRALSGSGSGAGLTARVLGQNGGAESTSITLTALNLPPHSHTYSFPAASNSGAVGGFSINAGGGVSNNTGNGPGTATPFSVPTIQPTSYMNIFIKL